MNMSKLEHYNLCFFSIRSGILGGLHPLEYMKANILNEQSAFTWSFLFSRYE